MTAINLVVQRDAVHLLTDGALYDHDGIIRAIASKSVVSQQHRMAIVPSGMATGHQVAAGLNRHGARTQARALAALPAVAAEIKAFNVAGNPPGDHDLQLFVAIWSDCSDRGEAWILSTNRAYFGEGYMPGTLAEIEKLIGMDIDLGALQGRRIDYSDARSFDAECDGLALLEAQRRKPWDDGVFFVGGHAELSTVTRTGVAQKILRKWPDQIGERITV